MKSKEILSSALIGTSAMTCYSYIQSGKELKDFREPKLLHSLIDAALPDSSVPRVSGWILHYAVGLGFAAGFHLIWKKSIQPSISSGIFMGAASGILGIGAWSIALKVHPSPPRLDRMAFYRHLLVAHMVYGAFVALSKKNLITSF